MRTFATAAIEDMIHETSTKAAPWYLIPSNSKLYSRVAAMRILVDRLGKDVSLEPRPLDPKLLKQAKRALQLSAADLRRARMGGKRITEAKRRPERP